MVKRKLTEADILSLPELYASGLSSWAIAKKFNTYHSNILHHLKKLKAERRNKSLAAKEGVKAGRIPIKRNKIPAGLELTEDLAYILGVLAGDGYMHYNINQQSYYAGLSATDKEFVEKFRKVLFNFFKINPTNEFKKSKKLNYRDQYISRMCSKEACDFINSFGSFGKYCWKVPEVIIGANNQIKSAFIKGFFDSEGEIDKKSRRVGATSVNLEGLKQVGGLLGSLGIRYSITSEKTPLPNRRLKSRLRIQDRKSVELFNKHIGFTITRKQLLLNTFLGSYKFTKILPERLNELKKEAIYLREKGLSYASIANKLNMSLSTVWNVCNLNKARNY